MVVGGPQPLEEEEDMQIIYFGDRDQLLCAPRRTLCSQYSNNAEEETINIV